MALLTNRRSVLAAGASVATGLMLPGVATADSHRTGTHRRNPSADTPTFAATEQIASHCDE